MSASKGKPFTDIEVKTLIDLVKIRSKILESKITDKFNNVQKEKAWGELEKEFNSRGSYFRTSASLKNKWFLMKKKARNEVAALRYEGSRTGGGPSSAANLSYTSEKVLETCSALSMIGSSGGPCSDGDAVVVVKPTVEDNPGEILRSEYYEFQIGEELIVESGEFEADGNNNNTQETINTQNNIDETLKDDNKLKDSKQSGYEAKWNSYTPAMLKKARSRKLMTKTPAKTKRNCEQYSDNLASKQSILSLQELHVQKMLKAQAREDEMKEEKHKANMAEHLKKDLHLTRMLEMQETDKKRKEEIHQAEMAERAMRLKILGVEYASIISNDR
ncbi:hypothetical protein WDU94_015607 [Cyamophila willieti]